MTSSVDRRTESGILDAMAKLMEGRTVFMIAHHASTLAHCDMMLRIEQGRLSLSNCKERETSFKS